MPLLRQLSGAALHQAVQRLQDPAPGSKIAAAKAFGVDLTLLIEQIQLSPAERAQRMHRAAQAVAAVTGRATKHRP